MSSEAQEPVLQIKLNGEQFAIRKPATVASLIATRQPRPPFAVELNQELVRRPEYASRPLIDGDSVEIVTLVGGG